MSYFGNIGFKDNGMTDAFARLRMSAPQTIFDSKQLVDKQPLFWDDQQTSGSGTSSTYNTNQASTTIAVSNATAGTRVRQTFRRFNYQPGKSQLVLMTGIFGSTAVGINKRIGIFDTNNGLYFERAGAVFSVVNRTFTSGSAVNTSVAQSLWNINKMDGTGADSINLDFTKCQIMVIDFEWLGVGRVRMGFVVDGLVYYCHEFLNANNSTLVYMSSPNLPLRYEISNNGAGGVASLVHICSTVISEGGVQTTGFPFSINRGDTPLVTLNNNSFYPLFAMRLKSGYFGSTIRIKDFNIICSSTSVFNYTLILNPTVTGTALSFTGITNSSIEAQVNTTNATTVSGGTVIHSGTSQQTNDSSVNDNMNSDFYLGSTIAGVSDIVVLAVQRATGTTETFYGSLNWVDQQ